MLRKTLWTALLVAATTAQASAALWSPPLSGSNHSRLSCRVMNVSAFTRHVTIQIAAGADGSVLANSVLDLAPGKSMSATTSSAATGFCWVGGITKGESRITFSAVDENDYSTIAAVQVR